MFTDLIPSFTSTASWFDDAFADFNSFMKNSKLSFDDSFPPLNVYLSNDNNGFYLEMSLVGYKKEWLSVEVDGSRLFVKAEVPELSEDDSKRYIKRRIQAKSFEKVYRLTDGYDTDKAEVSFEDGLLTIFCPPKKKLEPKTKTLLIN